MAERTRVRDGTPIYYGLGLAVRRYRGLTVLCHTGSQPGYKAHIAYVPARDLGVVILSNREDTRPAALAASIMAEAIGDDFPAPYPGRAPDGVSRRTALTARQLVGGGRQLRRLETGGMGDAPVEDGVLRGETLGDPVFLYGEGGGVFRDGDDYRATVPSSFAWKSARGPEDVTCRMNLGGQRIALRKSGPPRYAPMRSGAFSGRYESAEIGSRHSIRASGMAR